MRTSVSSEAGRPASGEVCQKSVSGIAACHAGSSTTLPSTTGGTVTLTARARGGCTGAISWASANRPEAATTQTASDTAQRRMCARDMNNSLGRMNLGGQRGPGISCWLPCGGERTGSTCDFIRPWCRASPWTAMKPSAVVWLAVFNPIAQRLRRESPFKADDDDADEWIGTIELHSGWRVLWQVHFEVLSSRLRPGCAETAIVNRTQWLLAL